MTDLEAIAYWVNPGERFGNAMHSNKCTFSEKDVYYISKLGSPTINNVDFFFKAYSSSRRRLVVSGVVDACGWVKYFNRVNSEFMEVDDNTFIFDKEL